MNQDLYAILGILPEAENEIISAAHLTLLTHYHSIRTELADSESKEIIRLINLAHEILINHDKRLKYDQSTKETISSPCRINYHNLNPAFKTAIHSIADQWKVAIDFYPELDDERTRLLKYSTPLSYSYMVLILQSKRFLEGKSIADHFAKLFIKRHFGSNKEIARMAELTIENNNKAATIELNEYISVIGESSPEKIIEKIAQKHGAIYLPEVQDAIWHLKQFRKSESAEFICQKFGCDVEKKMRFGGFAFVKYIIKPQDGDTQEFTSSDQFIDWVLSSFIPEHSPH